MKRKFRTPKNYLKLGILLFSVSLLLWNCQKEDVININTSSNDLIPLSSIQEKYNKQFNSEKFASYKNEPIWEELVVSKLNDVNYYEIPLRNFNSIDLAKSTSISYDKLVAYKNAQTKKVELNIIHFFTFDKQNIVSKHQLSLNSLDTYTGFLTFYDLDKNVLKSHRYINGEKTLKDPKIKDVENKNLLARASDEGCERKEETVYTKHIWFWIFSDGSIQIVQEYVTSEMRVYWACDDVEGMGDSPGGGETYVEEKIEVKIINNLTNECAKDIFTELENGLYKNHPLKPEVQIPNSVDKMNFSESILKLFNDSNKTNYIINNGNLNGKNAYTSRSTTTISNDYLGEASKLSIARTMIHEQVHAYINAIFFGYPDFDNKPFKDKLRLFAKQGGYVEFDKFHHEFMGQYVDAMAHSLYQWDKRYGSSQGSLGWDYYKSMAYGGLFQTDSNGNIVTETNSFKSLVPNANDRKKIAKIVFNETKGNKDAKGKKCN